MDAVTRRERLKAVNRWVPVARNAACFYGFCCIASVAVAVWGDHIPLLQRLPDALRGLLAGTAGLPKPVTELVFDVRFLTKTSKWLREVYSGTGSTQQAEAVFARIAIRMDGRDLQPAPT